MNELPSPLQLETGGAVTQNHGGSGNNNANTGGGLQHNGPGDINRNDIHGNAYFGKKLYSQRSYRDLTCTLTQTINPTFNNFGTSMPYYISWSAQQLRKIIR